MPTLTERRIRHGVVFSLKHEEGSDAEADFLRANGAPARVVFSCFGADAVETYRKALATEEG